MSMPTIMVVDDCHSARLTVQRILEDTGYPVIVAINGEEALTKLVEQPALIVLDVYMPVLDGYGFCEEVSSICPEIPIVFLTTENSMALRMLGDELGAYLRKPVCQDELLDVIESQLSQPTS